MIELEKVLRANKDMVGGMLPIDLNRVRLFVYDFTSGNNDLEKLDMNSVEEFDSYLKETLRKNSAVVGIGRYNEDRIIYRHSNLFGRDEEVRTIHLGIDIFLPAGTEILSPLDARLHSFQNNVGNGDYGPTIILRHEIQNIVFYTLYGHLSEDSLVGKYEGQIIRKGEVIAKIGNKEINGNWPEHVHFQIIQDLEGRRGDFPGVSSISERERYLRLCPDPNLILKINKMF